MAERRGVFRRAWEWIGHLSVVSWILDGLRWLFALHWPLPVSAVLASGFGFWAWDQHLGHLPIALITLSAFVAVIWGLNGIIWLSSQRRPSQARITFDYSYGLTLEAVQLGFDTENLANTLEIRPYIRNSATGPIKILVEKIHVTIEDRFYTLVTPFGATMPRFALLTLFPGGGFTKEAYEKFKDRTHGELELSIIYGHPDDQFSRRFTKVVRLDLFKQKKDEMETVSVNWILKNESDVVI